MRSVYSLIVLISLKQPRQLILGGNSILTSHFTAITPHSPSNTPNSTILKQNVIGIILNSTRITPN